MKVLSRCGLLSLMFLAGCAGFFLGGLQPVDEVESHRVIEALRQKEKAIQTLRGLFEASISGSGVPFNQNLQGMFSYEQPDVLHLKSFVRLGVPVMDFHRDGSHYDLYFPAEGKLISGNIDGTTEPTKWDQTIMLSIRALDAVLGKIAGLSSEDVRVLKTENRYRIDMPAGQRPSSTPQNDFSVRTWVDAQTLELISIEYRRIFDDIIVSVECKDYRDVQIITSEASPPFRLPFLVQAKDHRPAGGSLTLHFQEFVLNATS